MNIRKPTDYSDMYAALDRAISGDHTQMQTYALIGQAVSSRGEKGAAVAAAEHLQEHYPDISGFSPRNLRRMRDFYRTYGQDEAALNLAMLIGWTQNVVILEAELTNQERAWYLKQVASHGWSKKVLAEHIQNEIHLVETLDDSADSCYTVGNETALGNQNEESIDRQPVGISFRTNKRTDREPLCDEMCLRGEDGPPTGERRLRQIRHPVRNGAGRLAGHIPYLRRRFRREDFPPNGVYRANEGVLIWQRSQFTSFTLNSKTLTLRFGDASRSPAISV